MKGRTGVFLLILLGFHARGQQNFFNVPSADITAPKKVFFQQQLNFYDASTVSNTTLDYGLGHGLEIGLNCLGLTYDFREHGFAHSARREQPAFPTIGINAQKQLLERGKYGLYLGGQALLSTYKPVQTEWYAYVNNKVELGRLHLVGGLFVGNNNYLNAETRLVKGVYEPGVQLGLEYALIKDRLFFQADYISGRTALSNLIVGAACNLTKQWILSAGYQIPDDNETSPNGAILELTFIQ